MNTQTKLFRSRSDRPLMYPMFLKKRLGMRDTPYRYDTLPFTVGEIEYLQSKCKKYGYVAGLSVLITHIPRYGYDKKLKVCDLIMKFDVEDYLEPKDLDKS